MKVRGIDKVFSVFFLLAILIISIICNIGDFSAGANGEINPLTVAITTIYVVYCSAFALFSHNRKNTEKTLSIPLTFIQSHSFVKFKFV